MQIKSRQNNQIQNLKTNLMKNIQNNYQMPFLKLHQIFKVTFIIYLFTKMERKNSTIMLLSKTMKQVY